MDTNSEERFVVAFVTRSTIAQDLNDYIEDSGEFLGVAKFEPNDARLTGILCQNYADALGRVDHLSEDDSNFEEAKAAALVAILKTLA